MKITTIIDKTKEEEIIICAHEKTKLINDIEMFVTKKELLNLLHLMKYILLMFLIIKFMLV